MKRIALLWVCFWSCAAFAQHDWTALELQTIKRYAPDGYPELSVTWDRSQEPDIDGYWVVTFVPDTNFVSGWRGFLMSYVTNEYCNVSDLFRLFEHPKGPVRLRLIAVTRTGAESDLSEEFVDVINEPPVAPVGVVVEEHRKIITEERTIYGGG